MGGLEQSAMAKANDRLAAIEEERAAVERRERERAEAEARRADVRLRKMVTPRGRPYGVFAGCREPRASDGEGGELRGGCRRWCYGPMLGSVSPDAKWRPHSNFVR